MVAVFCANFSNRIRIIPEIKMASAVGLQSQSQSNMTDSFSCTDAEIELLLDVIKRFQFERQFEGVDWERVKSKYDKIKDILIERYPTSGKPEDFPKKKSCLHELITKDSIAAKVKTIRKNYMKAVDQGRRSSGGRVVCTFYDLCNDIWSGSPATQSIDGE